MGLPRFPGFSFLVWSLVIRFRPPRMRRHNVQALTGGSQICQATQPNTIFDPPLLPFLPRVYVSGTPSLHPHSLVSSGVRCARPPASSFGTGSALVSECRPLLCSVLHHMRRGAVW
uniref:Uncharacterized protein n=1 Tax=Eutreptiella gymnastica TaxID=73025 RepID=A0A7S4LB03_9EUGL